jgi:hypothetical protein
MVMRQKTCLMAVGRLLRGLAVSAAAWIEDDVSEHSGGTKLPLKKDTYQSDQFSTRVGKSGRNKHSTQPLKPVVKRTGIFPVRPTDVAACWRAANVDHNTEKNEPNDGGHLENRKNKLGFAIALDACEVDAHNDNQKQRDKDGAVEVGIPVGDGQGAGDDLQGQHHNPL